MGLKTTEILLILAVLLLLFGATRLPQLGSSLGSAIRNFKRGFGGEEDAGGGDKKAALTSTSSTEKEIGGAKTSTRQG